MVVEIDQARREGDTLAGGGGPRVRGARRGRQPRALGPALDAALAGALMSIPGIKGVEVGDGFAGRLAGGGRPRRHRLRRGRLGPGDGRAGGIEGA